MDFEEQKKEIGKMKVFQFKDNLVGRLKGTGTKKCTC
jgi:hypothetical protein